MTQTKNWQKVSENVYAFSENGSEIGTLERLSGKVKAIFTMGSHKFSLEKTGFWGSTMNIVAENGEIVLTAYPPKWYANRWILEFEGNSYTLEVRNNPLAEWAILKENVTVLAYGVSTENGKAITKITASNTPVSPLFDFLLWYLFSPIISENASDNLILILLAAAS
jgi:hypothetical protein